MELPQLMVASRRIGENFNAIKAHENVGAKGPDQCPYIATQHWG